MASGPRVLASIIEVWGVHSPRDAVWSLIVPVGSGPARGRIADVVCAKRRCGSPLGRPQSSYNQRIMLRSHRMNVNTNSYTEMLVRDTLCVCSG